MSPLRGRATVIVAFGTEHWGALMPIVPPLIFLLRAFLLGRFPRRRNPLPPAPKRPPEPTLRQRWQTARSTHERTSREYAAFECDALAVLRLPDLVDTSVPATARFVEAFAEACALATDRQPQDEHAEQFIAAAESSDRAWQAARSAAERMRRSRFDPAEREALDRAIKLLMMAQESDHAGERRAAYDKAREQLAVLERRTGWTMPAPAVAELERRVQGELA
jgi:hypothetical protein